MVQKAGVLLILTFLLNIIIVSAVGTDRYPQPGGVGQDYSNEGRGEFILINNEFDFVQFAKNLGGSLGTPIIDDLDNNSVSELIIIDQDQVKIFQNKELDIIATFDFGDVPSDISNVLSFDIDGDGLKEIIFMIEGTTNQLKIFNFSEADGIQLQTEFSVLGTTVVHPMIGCRAVNECIGTLNSGVTQDVFNSFTAFHRGIAFDSTNVTTSPTFTIFSEGQPSSDAIALCSPRDKNIIVDDYDGDGNLEYILSMGLKEDSGGNNFEVHIFWLDNITQEQTGSETESVSDLVVDCGGVSGITNAITSPISQEVDSGESRREAIFGMQTSNNDFRIILLSGSDGELVDEFPEKGIPIFNEADGNIISNVMFGQFMPETGANDVCVMGFDPVNDNYELLCGNRDRPLISHAILEFPTSSLAFNISDDINEQHHLIHGVQFSDVLQDSKDLEEVLSTHGVFELDYSGFDNVLERIFDPETTRGVNLGIDLEQFGQDDIISMTDTNIFYFDDKGTNNPAEIVEITYNPCPVNTLIKVNSSFQVQVEARDTNLFALGFDDLNFKAFVYFNDVNQDNRSLPNISTSQVDGSATVIFAPLFIMNKTITNGIIRVEVFDTKNPSEIDINEQLFSVAQNGLEFGDATCTIEIAVDELEAVAEEEIEELIQTSRTDNGLTTGLLGVAEITGLSVFIIWLLVMAIVAVGIFVGGQTILNRVGGGEDSSAKLAVVIIVEIILLVIGTVLGFIPLGVVITIVVLGLISVALFFNKIFTGTNNA